MVTPLLGPEHASPARALTASVIIDSLGRRFTPSKHPRDRKGRFIETFGEVRAFAKGRPTNPAFTGRVLAMNPDGTTSIEITGPPKNAPQLKGQVVHNIPSDQLENVEYKARLGQPAARTPSADESASINDFVARIRARNPNAPDAPNPNEPPDQQLARLEEIAEAAEDANLPDERDGILDIKAQMRGEPTGQELEAQVKAKLGQGKQDTTDHGTPDAAPAAPETDDTPNAAALPDDNLSPEDERSLYRGVTPDERDALDAAREGAGPDPRAYYDALDKINANVEAASRRADKNPDNQDEQDRLSRLAKARNQISDWAAENNLPDTRRKATTTPAKKTPPKPPREAAPDTGFDPARATADDFNKRDMPPEMAALYDHIKAGTTPEVRQAAQFEPMLQHMYEQRNRVQTEANRQGPRSNEARQLKKMKSEAPTIRAWGDDAQNKSLIEQGKRAERLSKPGDGIEADPEVVGRLRDPNGPQVEQWDPNNPDQRVPTPAPAPAPAPAPPEPTPEPPAPPERPPVQPVRPQPGDPAPERPDYDRLTPMDGESPEDYALRLAKINRDKLPPMNNASRAEHQAASFAQENHELQHEAALRRVQAWEAWNATRPEAERDTIPPPPLMNQLRRTRRLGGLNPDSGRLSKRVEQSDIQAPGPNIPPDLTRDQYIAKVERDIANLEAVNTDGWGEATKSVLARQIQSNQMLLARLRRDANNESADIGGPDNGPWRPNDWTPGGPNNPPRPVPRLPDTPTRPTPAPGDSRPGPNRPGPGSGGDTPPVPAPRPGGTPATETPVAPGVINYPELVDGQDGMDAQDLPPQPLSPESQAELDAARKSYPDADFFPLIDALRDRDNWDRIQAQKPASQRRAAPKAIKDRINAAYLDLAAQTDGEPENPNDSPFERPSRLSWQFWQNQLLYSDTDNPWLAMGQLAYGLYYDIGRVVIRMRNGAQRRRSRREVMESDLNGNSNDNIAVQTGVAKPRRPATPTEATAEVEAAPDASPEDSDLVRRLRQLVAEDAANRAATRKPPAGMDTPLREGDDSMVISVVPVDPADPNSDLELTAGLMPALPAGFTKVPDGSPAKLLANELRNHPANEGRPYRQIKKAQDLANALSQGRWSAVPSLLADLKSDSPFSQDFTNSVDRQIRGMFANPATIYKQIGAAQLPGLPEGWEEVDPDDWAKRNWVEILQANGMRGMLGQISPAKINEFMEFLGVHHPDARPRRVYRKGDMNIALTEDYDPKYVSTVMNQLDYLQQVDGLEGEKNILLTSYNNTSDSADTRLGDAYAGGNMVRYDIGRVIDIVEGRTPMGRGHFKDVATRENLLRYVVTHEWGHMRGPRAPGDKSGRIYGELADIADNAMRRMGARSDFHSGRNRVSGLTQYERTNAAEFYAENYAEFMISGGNPTSKSGRAMAISADWADNIDVASAQAPGDPVDAPNAPDTTDNQSNAPPKINYPGDPSHLTGINDPDTMRSELRGIAERTTNGVLRGYAERLGDQSWYANSPLEARTLFHDSILADPDISRDKVFLAGLQHMARSLDPEYGSLLNRREREGPVLDTLVSAGLLNDASQLPVPAYDGRGKRERLVAALMRLNGTSPETVREMYPDYADDAALDKRLTDAHVLDESLRIFTGKFRTSYVPGSADETGMAAQKNYIDAINADFPADGTPEQVANRATLTELYNAAFPEGIRRFEVDGSYTPTPQPDPASDPEAQPRTPNVPKPAPGDPDADPDLDERLRKDGVNDRAIDLMKEYFRGRIERAKRGIGNVMLSRRTALDADGNEVKKGDIVWMGALDARGGGRTPGAKARPDADGYIQNIVYARDPQTKQVALDANGQPIISEVVVRHFDPAYIGTEHERPGKRAAGIPWPMPYWDFVIRNPASGQFKFKKIEDSSPRAQAVIENFGLHGRRLAGGQAGRFAPSIGKVNRLARMGRVKPIQNRFAYDARGRLVGEGDIVRYKGNLFTVVRPNNPWNNGGNPRVRLEPIGGGRYSEPAASQVEYVDDPKSEVFFRGAGGQAAPQPQDVADTLARRGFPINEDVRDALRNNDINALAKAIAANPDVQGFLEKELYQREDMKDRIEQDNRVSAGEVMPGGHNPVTPEEYAKKRQDMADAIILNAAGSGLFAREDGAPRRVNDKVQRDLYGDYVGAERDVAMRRAYLDLFESLDNSTDPALAKPVGDAYALLAQIGNERLDTPQGRANIRRTLDKMDDILDTQGSDPTGLGSQINDLRETYGLWEAEKLATPERPLPGPEGDQGEGATPPPAPPAPTPAPPEAPGLPAPPTNVPPEAPPYVPTNAERDRVGQRIDAELEPQILNDIAEHAFDPDDENDESIPEEVVLAREQLARTLRSYKRSPLLRATRARENMQKYRTAVEEARDAAGDSPEIDRILADIDAWEARLDEITNFDQPFLPTEEAPVSPRRRPRPTPEAPPAPEPPAAPTPAPTPGPTSTPAPTPGAPTLAPIPNKPPPPTAAQVAAAKEKITSSDEPHTRGETDTAALLDAAGYNGKPHVFSTEDFNAIQGVALKYFDEKLPRDVFLRAGRGGKMYNNLAHGEPDAYYVGRGIFGHGTFIGNETTADVFGGSSLEKTRTNALTKPDYYGEPETYELVRVKIHPDAVVVDWKDVPQAVRDNRAGWSGGKKQTIAEWAVANGVDVVNTSDGDGDDLAGVNVLNRAVLILEAMDGDGELSPRVPGTSTGDNRAPAVDEGDPGQPDAAPGVGGTPPGGSGGGRAAVPGDVQGTPPPVAPAPPPTPPAPPATPPRPPVPSGPYQGNAAVDLGFPDASPQAKAVAKLYRGAPLSSSERTNLMRATRATGARAQQQLLRPLPDAERAKLEQQILAAQDVIQKLTSGRRPR